MSRRPIAADGRWRDRRQGVRDRIERIAAAAKQPRAIIPATPPITAAATDRAGRFARAARYVSTPPTVASMPNTSPRTSAPDASAGICVVSRTLDRVHQVEARAEKCESQERPGRCHPDRPHKEACSAARSIRRAGRDVASGVHRLGVASGRRPGIRPGRGCASAPGRSMGATCGSPAPREPASSGRSRRCGPRVGGAGDRSRARRQARRRPAGAIRPPRSSRTARTCGSPGRGSRG